MTFLKVINVVLFNFESCVVLILPFIIINGKSIFLLTNIIFLVSN